MSIWDDLMSTAHDILTGNLGKAVGDAGRTVHDVVGGGESTPTADGMIQGVNLGPILKKNQAAAQGGGTAGAATSQCCDRYRFESGFLVDGATGAVWKYDDQSKSFEEVAVHRDKSKQALVDTLIETKLAALRGQYEREVLPTTPPASRAKLLAEFEKEQLTPMRDAAKATQY
jgi:hypothetical protein